MRIQPISLNTYGNNLSSYKKVSFKQSQTVNPNEYAKRTSEPNLSTYIDLMGDKLKLDKNIEFFVNGLKKIDTSTKREHKPLEIADVGCCDGALCRTLSRFLPVNTKYYGLDLSSEMLDRAKETDKILGRKNTFYETGNAFGLPYEKESKDAIILSSIMHELYSYPSEEYNEEAYSKDSILHFMQKAYDCLKPGGVLIIKDPATASVDAWEPVKIANANKTDGELPVIEDEKELAKADITKLSTYDKLRRFTLDFYPAATCKELKWDENGDCIMPRWLVTEWVRHRKWLRTPENWAYEIKENYGTLRPDELANFAQNTGFSVVKVENISIPDKVNIYRVNDGEFQIKDVDDNNLSLEDFPMFLEAVLKKPRK